jgi:hypothetical protein
VSQAESPSARYLYVMPEVRVGMRLGERLELSAGVEAMVLLAISQPTWSDARPVVAATDGLATFGAQELAGRTILVVAPGLGARYEF